MIRYQYSSYIKWIGTKLEEKGVTVKKLRAYLLTLPAFDKRGQDSSLLLQRKEELERATDITDVTSSIARECASFLEYDIFQGIVDAYELDQTLEHLRYPEHLKAFIQKHTLAEFMKINPALEKYSGAEELILKFDLDLSKYKLAKLLDLKNAVAAILGLKSSALRLLSAEEGCLDLKFLIPEFIAKIIFTDDNRFSLKQMQDFKALSLVWLKCGNCEFPFRCLSDADTEGKK